MKSSNQSLLGGNAAARREGVRVETCSQVSRGDLIEARVGTTGHVWGEVVDIQPSMELFWVISRDGSRRIVELSEFEVYFAAQPLPVAGIEESRRT